MGWLKLDDNVSHHPKMLAAGAAACWLWVCGLSYCQRQNTDGRIPKVAVSHLGVDGWKHLAGRLVAARLWTDEGDIYRIHDYLDWNDSAAERKRKADERNARVTRFRTRTQRDSERDSNTAPPPTPTPQPVQERTAASPPRPVGQPRASTWKRAVAIAHEAIEAYPQSLPDQADAFKAACGRQGIDYGAKGGKDARPLYTRALEFVETQRARRVAS